MPDGNAQIPALPTAPKAGLVGSAVVSIIIPYLDEARLRLPQEQPVDASPSKSSRSTIARRELPEAACSAVDRCGWKASRFAAPVRRALGGLGWPAPQQPDRAGVLRAHLQPSRSGSGVADLPRAATWRPGPPSSSPSPLWRHLHEGSEAMGGVLPWPIASPIRPMCGCRRRRADPSPSWPAGGYGPSRMKTGISTAAPPPPLHGQPAAQWRRRTDKVSGGAIGGSHLPARPASECLTSRSPAMLGSRGKPHRQTSHVGRVAEAASRARGIDHTV